MPSWFQWAVPFSWSLLKLFAMLLAAGWFASRVCDFIGIQELWDRLLHGFAFGLSLLLGAALLLLWIGQFAVWQMIFVLSLAAVATATGLPDAPKREKPPRKTGTRPSAQFLKTPESAARRTTWIPVLLFFGALVSVFFVSLFQALSNPPLSGDGLAYHLPMAAQWCREGTIWAQDVRAWFYPGNSELLLAILMLPFRGDAVIGVSDSVYWLVLVLALGRLMRMQGLSAWASLGSAVLVATTPLFRRSLGELGNDLFLAMLFLLALYFIAQARESVRPGAPALLAIASASLLVGTKYNGVAYALGLAFVAAWHWPRKLWKWLLRHGVPIVATGLLLGGSFFIRNLVLTGNPVYPAGVDLGPLQIPPGDMSLVVGSASGVTQEFLRTSTLWGNARGMEALFGFGNWFLQLAWPSLVLCFLAIISWLMGRKPARGQRALQISPLLLLLFGCGLIFALTPLCVENIPGALNQVYRGRSLRYALPFFLLAALLLTSVTHPGKGFLWLPALGVVANFLTPSARWGMQESLLFGILSMLSLALPCIRPSRLSRASGWFQARRARKPFGFIYLGLLLFGLLAMALHPMQQARRARFYTYSGFTQVIPWLEDLEDNRVLLVSIGIRNYPFFGSHLQHRVVTLGLAQTAEEWRKKIVSLQPDYIIVSRESGDRASPDYGRFPRQEAAVLTRPRAFGIVYADSFVRVYKTPWTKKKGSPK